MIVTFYSYKGGVGRSLALANIACLMAGDPSHPQRVLVWDFDLEAPGLHRLFPARQPHPYGFVDLAYEFAMSGNVPKVEDYIYESEIEGVHVLPAGKMGETYCGKLQAIDWLRFFGSDPKSPGPFFGELLEEMGNLVNPFDYILIDSRTGLNDQAGICTQVLPDLLVVLFRLTTQNLDGLEHMVPAIASQLRMRGKESTQILPVASQVRAATSNVQASARQAALKIFDKDLEYIRFDEDLVGTERLLCLRSELDTMWPCPPVVDDYRRICDSIRNRNPEDTRSQMEQLRTMMRQGDTATASTMLLRLLPRRPRLDHAWKALSDVFDHQISESRTRELYRVVSAILRMDSDNFFAQQWKAAFQSSKAQRPTDPAIGRAKTSLLRAIKSAPDAEKGNILRSLALLASIQGDLATGVRFLREVRLFLPKNNQVNLDLAMFHMRMGAKYFAVAADELEEIPPEIGDQKYASLAYLRAFLGENEKASEALRFCDKSMQSLVRAHMHLIQGNTTEAVRFVEKNLSSGEPQRDLSNWVEFYLCAGAFSKAISLVDSAPQPPLESMDVLQSLKELAEFLMKQGSPQSPEAQSLVDKWGKTSWDFRELLMFRERSIRDRKEYIGSLGVIERLIQYSELRQVTASGMGLLKRLPRSRAARMRLEFTME